MKIREAVYALFVFALLAPARASAVAIAEPLPENGTINVDFPPNANGDGPQFNSVPFEINPENDSVSGPVSGLIGTSYLGDTAIWTHVAPEDASRESSNPNYNWYHDPHYAALKKLLQEEIHLSVIRVDENRKTVKVDLTQAPILSMPVLDQFGGRWMVMKIVEMPGDNWKKGLSKAVRLHTGQSMPFVDPTTHSAQDFTRNVVVAYPMFHGYSVQFKNGHIVKVTPRKIGDAGIMAKIKEEVRGLFK